MMKELVRRWEMIGLLEGITSEEEKELLAVKCEELAIFLLAHEGEYTNLETLIFPLLRRVFWGSSYSQYPERRVKHLNPLHLLEGFKTFAEVDGHLLIEDLNSASSIDVEAELLTMYAEMYINDHYKKEEVEPLQYLPKHRLT